MDRYSEQFYARVVDHAPRAYLIEVAATAHAQGLDGTHIVEIHWVRMAGDWFAAWQCRPSSRVGEGKFVRAPLLDAANEMRLGQTVGEVVMPGCLNYGENGVLQPGEPVVQEGLAQRRKTVNEMHERLRQAILANDIRRATQVVDEIDKAGLWGDHPRGDTIPGPGHVYECCGKTGRISRHESWCKNA